MSVLFFLEARNGQKESELRGPVVFGRIKLEVLFYYNLTTAHCRNQTSKGKNIQQGLKAYFNKYIGGPDWALTLL